MSISFMLDKLIHLLNVLQSNEGYSVEQIREYMQAHMSHEERFALRLGYDQGKTSDMGDSVLVAVSLLPKNIIV